MEQMKKMNMDERQEHPFDYRCPITCDLLCDPVIGTDGFTYEREAIERWYEEKNTKSPKGGFEIRDKKLIGNTLMQHMINKYRHLLSRTHILSGGNIYSKHKSPPQTTVDVESKERLIIILDHYYKSTWELGKIIEEISNLYRVQPKDLEISSNYCNILRFAEKYEEAQYTLRKMKEDNPNSLLPNYIGIRTYAENGKRDEAQREFDNLVISRGLEEHSFNEIKFAAYANNAIGRKRQAGELIGAYLILFSSDLRAQSCRIYIDLHNKEYLRVIESSNKYLSICSDDVSILFHKAYAYQKIDKIEESYETYKYILEVTKDNSVKAKCHVQLSTLANSEYSTQTTQSIIDHLLRSYEYDPSEGADVNLAIAYLNKKEYNNSLQWILKVEERVDVQDDPLLLRIKAASYVGLHKYNQVITIYIHLSDIDQVNAPYYHTQIDSVFHALDTAKLGL